MTPWVVTERLRSIAVGAKSLWPASAPEISNAADEIDILRAQNAALLEALELCLVRDPSLANNVTVTRAIALAKGEK